MAAAVAGFQGEAGAFSEEALLALLGDVPTRGYRTFDQLVAAAASHEIQYGLLPCENTITGSIARSYDLLSQFRAVRIVDQTTHRVEQCLIGVPGSTIGGLTKVFSHPVALEQCRNFFARHPHIQPLEAHDTAGAVREIINSNAREIAAIGPALAAQRYGGTVLQRAIQDDAENYTRFFLISAVMPPRRTLGRTCVALHLPHIPGALHRVLGEFASRNINLRSLVARPRRGRPFEYTFYVELDGTLEIDQVLVPEHGEGAVLGRY